MKNEFALAFNQVLEEKQLPKEVIIEAIEAAMTSAYRRAVNASDAQHVEAQIDAETGDVEIFAEKEIVQDVQDERTEVTLDDALKVDPEAQIGGIIIVESTPRDFGRVAAQTARQVIQQRIREAERNMQFEHFTKQKGEIISGIVQAINNGNVSLGMDLGSEGVLARKDQIPGERFRIHDRVRALLSDVKLTPRGPQITLSRSHRNFLRRLLENEVPEIFHGVVEIRSIAREPGYRSKVAVAALKPGIDPVGACVGIRGVRIQAIVRELHEEKIDVIEWNPDPKVYIAKALSPARVVGVYLDEFSKGAKTATVVVPEDQLSLAIGRDGQNARLSAKLTSWRIDIKSQLEATTDILYKLQNDLEYSEFYENEKENIPGVEAILTKKQEGRPITPEEYQSVSKFVDRIENGVIAKRQETRRGKEERLLQAQAKVPAAAFNRPLEDLDLGDRIFDLLAENGYSTVGELMLQMELDADVVLSINGIGPRAITEIQERVEAMQTQMKSEEMLAEEIPQILAPEEGIAEAAAEVPVEIAEEAAGVEPTLTEEGQPVEREEYESILAPIQQGADVETITTEDEGELEEEEEEEEEETTGEEELVYSEDGELTGKKKKKKKFVEVEYDPDKDVMIVKRKRKRDESWSHGEWEEW
jgi:N utilization substance protein A